MCELSKNATTIRTKNDGLKVKDSKSRFQSRVMAALGIGLLAVSLAACAETGPEPVAFDQNPGSNAAPSSVGD